MRTLLLATGVWLIATSATAETYRLVHALGNSERAVEKNLSKRDCETRKAEYKKVAEALGTYNERLGHGSITCLPDSLFAD